MYLASKTVYHKPYRDLQSLSMPTHLWKYLSMDFITGLLILANWKGDNNDSILVIIDQLTKMVHYEPVKIMINASSLAEVIIDVVICHHRIFKSIITY